MHLHRALRFLYRMLGRPDPSPGEPTTLATAAGPVEADLYRPTDPWCTVLVLHGLALRGHRDPRLTNIGQALAHVGVFAIAPRIDALARLRLHPPASDTITALLRMIRDSPTLGRPNRVGIFGPSFAGSQSLVSAAEPDLRSLISGMLLIGPYADARDLLSHVLQDDGADPYGRLILIRHFLEQVGDLSDGMAAAIDANLADLGLEEGPPGLPAVLEQIPPSDEQRFLQLRDDVSARQHLAMQILETHGASVDELSILSSLNAVRAPIVLLHGAHDPVIPTSQSVRIRDALATSGRAPRLVITPLLDHGNVMARGRALLDVPRVINGFAQWFRALAR